MIASQTNPFGVVYKQCGAQNAIVNNFRLESRVVYNRIVQVFRNRILREIASPDGRNTCLKGLTGLFFVLSLTGNDGISDKEIGKIAV